MFPEIDNHDDSEEHSSMCEDCNVPLLRNNTQMCVCGSCGLEVYWEIDHSLYTNNMATSYNCGGQSHIYFKVNGMTKSAHLQNSLMMGVSNSSALKKKRIRAKIMKWIIQVPDEDDSIPLNVVDETVEAYCDLQAEQKLVKRSESLNSVLAYILYNKCIELGVPRKPKVITKIAGVSDNQISAGGKVIGSLCGQTVIKEISSNDEYIDYIDQYFEKLGICENDDKEFVHDLIISSLIDKIRDVNNSSIPTTRVAGAIYILCQQRGYSVGRDDIEKQCCIAKSTFNRFINMITLNAEKKCIRKVFEKHGIKSLSRSEIPSSILL